MMRGSAKSDPGTPDPAHRHWSVAKGCHRVAGANVFDVSQSTGRLDQHACRETGDRGKRDLIDRKIGAGVANECNGGAIGQRQGRVAAAIIDQCGKERCIVGDNRVDYIDDIATFKIGDGIAAKARLDNESVFT